MNLYDWDDPPESGLCIRGGGDGSIDDEINDIAPLHDSEGHHMEDHHYYRGDYDHQFQLQPQLQVPPEDFHVPNLDLPPSALNGLGLPVGTPLLPNSLADPESSPLLSATSSTYSSCPPTPYLEDHLGGSREQSPIRDLEDGDIDSQLDPWLSRYEESSVSRAQKKLFSLGGTTSELMFAGLCFLPPLVIKVSSDSVTTTTTRPDSRAKREPSRGKTPVPNREQVAQKRDSRGRTGRSASPLSVNTNPTPHSGSCARASMIKQQPRPQAGTTAATATATAHSQSLHIGKSERSASRARGTSSGPSIKQLSLAVPAESRGRTRSKSLGITANIPPPAIQARRGGTSERRAEVGSGSATRPRSGSRSRRSSTHRRSL